MLQVKRPTLTICTSCESDDARGSGEDLYLRLKEARKEQKLKSVFKLEECRCLRGCDTPCNALLEGKKRKTIALTWLDAITDVQPLIDAAKTYSETGEPTVLPGRSGRGS